MFFNGRINFFLSAAMDRISNVPDNIIQLILERLPVIDRVRTSALSWSWRFHWKRLPSSLHLDREFRNSVPKQKNRNRSALERISAMNSLLMQHNISQLHEFSLHLAYSLNIRKVCFGQTIQIGTDIYQPCDKDLLVPNMSPSPHTLPPLPAFSSVHLTHLSLSECTLCHFSWFQGFPNLKSFELMCPRNYPPPAKNLSCFVSCCPKLQELKLWGLLYHENIELNAPMLRSLFIEGNLRAIALKNTQNLESFDMGVHFGDIGNRGNMFEFLRSSAKLTDITLQGQASRLLSLQGVLQWLPTLNHVKTLRFSDGMLHEANFLECVIGLCARSPNVEQIRISVEQYTSYAYQPVGVVELESLVQKYITRCCFGHHLRRINLVAVSARDVETKLMELFLSECIALEMMYINFYEVIPEPTIHRIKKYHRASAKAKMVLRKKKVE